MTYVKLDDALTEDDRVLGLTDKAHRLYIAAWCACSRNLTDGVVSVARLATLRAQTRATGRHVNELVVNALWEGEGPWKVVGFLDLNRSKDEVEALREERREAGRIGGQRSGESRKAQANSQALASALATASVSTIAIDIASETASTGGGPRARADEIGSDDIPWDSPPPLAAARGVA